MQNRRLFNSGICVAVITIVLLFSAVPLKAQTAVPPPKKEDPLKNLQYRMEIGRAHV